MSYKNHINKFQDADAIQAAVNNGNLLKPYVALAGNALDFNTKVVFDVDAQDMEFPASGGTSAITITASQDWTITLPAWLSASTLSGNSSQEVTVSATTTQQAHEGTISVSASTTAVTINVEQAEPAIDYSTMYFTVEMLEAGSFMNNKWLAYSINGGEWIDPEGAYEEIENLSQGDTIRFKTPENGLYDGLGDAFANNTETAFDVYGNIMSLICGDTFANATTIGNINFHHLFEFSSALNSAEHLVLPATNLLGSYDGEFGCYEAMFTMCSNLIAPPAVLPATTLAQNCYKMMFYTCENLEYHPVICGTTLAESCYEAMFSECFSLMAAPALPATTLATNCYKEMFMDCSEIASAPILPALTLVEGCYAGMFNNCTFASVTCLATDISATDCITDWLGGIYYEGVLYKNPQAGNIWEPGVNIPEDWTVQDYSA